MNMNKFGSAVFLPEKLVVGTKAAFCLVYKVGKSGIGTGGGIKLAVLHRGAFGPIQTTDPDKEGYVEAETSSKKACVNIPVGRVRNPMCVCSLSVVVSEAALLEGDTITVMFGANAEKFYVKQVSHKHRVIFRVDIDGSRNYVKLANPPQLEYISDKPVKLIALVPSQGVVDKPFCLHIKAVDEYGNVSVSYRGVVEFFGNVGMILPEKYTFTNKDKGLHLFEAKANTPGLEQIEVVDKKTNLSGKSNIIEIAKQELHYKIYWGEIHGQTLMSDGLKTPDSYYRYGRDVSRLDVCAITDHDTHMSGGRLIEGRIETETTQNIDEPQVTPFWSNPTDAWAIIKYETDRFNKPGKFTTLLGYEWTSGHGYTPEGMAFGHKNVYYLSDDEPMYSHINRESNTPERLWNLLKNKQAVTISHHTSLPVNPEPPCYLKRIVSGADWTHHDEDIERLVEIYSLWGASEYCGNPNPVGGYKPGGFVQEALARGYKLGFTAGSDTHWSRPGADAQDILRCRRSGLTAFLAKNLTREAIFDAMMNRRCYATTGARIILEFKLNGHMMGETTKANEGGNNKKRKIQVKVAGTAKIKKIDIVRNNIDIHTYRGKSEIEEVEYIDSENIANISLSNTVNQRRILFYYIRVTQEDGHLAWASPIWVQ